MTHPPAMLDVVRHAVRSVVERTPELEQQPELRRRLAENMVGVSLAAADLLDAERRFDMQVTSGTRTPRSRNGTKAHMPLAAVQAAGDIHRQTAVQSAAGVLQATRQAIDFPGFVTSLISGVFQAMTTSTIQQLEAYAGLLEAVNTSTSAFAANGITPGRAATWAVSQFSAFEITKHDPPSLVIREDGEMPDSEELMKVLEATEDEISEIDEDDLETTFLPLVRRKLARDRQGVLATMVLMGMNRIVVDEGRIHASMELQVDARSTAEQTQAERFDTRVTTSGSGSFGMGMWGASASLSATVGYVKSDEQFTREDIALRAGLRSSVDIGFHTEAVQLGRIASTRKIGMLKEKAISPAWERDNLLTGDKNTGLTPDTRKTKPDLGNTPELKVEAPNPASEAAAKLREKKNFDPPEETEEEKKKKKPDEKATSKDKPAEQTDATVDQKPSVKPEAKTPVKADGKAGEKPADKASVKADEKPPLKAGAKAGGKTATDPEPPPPQQVEESGGGG